MPLWLWTLLCIAGAALGLALHLALHPLRQALSEALDILRSHSWLLLFGTLAVLGAEWMGGDGISQNPVRSANEWMDWRALAPPLLKEAATRYALLLHQSWPPWPAALILPFLLLIGLLQLRRQPYRAGLKQRLTRADAALLIALVVLAFLWMGAESLLPQFEQSEIAAILRLGCRVLMCALHTAVVQVALVRIAVRWALPRADTAKQDAQQAWWEVLGRWRQVLMLAAFNAVWMALNSWSLLSGSARSGWLLVEMLIFFAPLPVAVAISRHTRFTQIGAQALGMLRQSVLALLGLGLTACAILALLLYANGILAELLRPWPLASTTFAVFRAFSLALVHNWLFLTAALVLIRRALDPAATDPTSTSKA